MALYMKKKRKVFFQKAVSICTGLLLVFQSLTPGFFISSRTFAQEAPIETPTPTVVPAPEQPNNNEVTPIPTPEVVSPTPNEEITPTINPSPSIEPNISVTPEPISEITPTIDPSVAEPTSTPSDPPKEASPPADNDNEASPEATPTPIVTPEPTPEVIEQTCEQPPETRTTSIFDWSMNEFTRTAETTTKVELGVKYEFPGNHDVSVTFTCLPTDTEKRTSLKIQEINISELKLPSDINASTDKAYDITTGMDNETFKYTITLPKTENTIAEVSYIEKTIEEVRTATDTLKTEDIQPIEETKTEQQNTTVKGNDIDHMTIFFVTSAIDAVSFWPDTLSDSEKETVKYSDDNRYENNGLWPIALEWDTEYIEFTHTNTLPSNITVTGANIIFEYQRSWRYWPAPEYAKIRVWDGSNWQLLPNDLWISNTNDKIFTISVPLTYVNTASKLNNFKYQFKLAGAPKTYIDRAVLDVTYASCGDNVVNQTTEECDGSSGVPSHYTCNSSCKLEALPYCGDGIINGSETCDGTNLGSNPATDFVCSSTCNLELLEKKVTICHASDSQTNPYIEQKPNKSADVSGHDGHNGVIWYPGIADHAWGDIIPPFYYVGGQYLGQNWDTAGQAIWNNGCVIPPTTGTLTVIKHVDNSGAGNKAAGDFSLSVTGANATPNVFTGQESGTTVTVDGSAAYSVTEGTYDHYDVSYSANCSGSITAGGSATCTVTNTYHPYCGDSFKDTIEQCDDGNNVDGDRCSATCQVETCNNLFFSEYIEGNSMNKAVEIYNPTANAISLTGYSVHKYTNGSSTSTQMNLSGTVGPGDVFVLANTSANATIAAQADQLSSILDFNGNDALALKYETTIIDSIGQIGYQPPSGEWGSGLTSTEDNTLTKKCGLSCGDANAYDTFDPSVQWNGYATNTFSFLGSHTPTCNCGDGFVNQLTEQCDAGSANGTFCTPTYGGTCDYCDASCQTNTITGPRCGDSTIDTGEQCDDGNTTDGDRCSATCQIETGTLRVQKTVNVADDLADWEFKLDTGSWIHANDTGVVDFGTVTTGNHTITEKTQTGYYLHSVTGCTPIKTNNNSATATVTVGQQTTCTFNNYAIPVYTGDSTCPASAPVKKLVNSYTIGSTDADGQVLSGLAAGNYLFETTGTFVSSSGGGWKSDAGYSSKNNWSSIDTNYGINGVAPNYGAHALLADLGSGMGIVQWGAYNIDHQYNFYTATPANPQFVIGDRWNTWYGTAWDNQGGMSDNSGSLTLNVYECQNYGSISGRKWEDINGNHIWNEGEPVVDGTVTPLKIFVDVDNNGTYNNPPDYYATIDNLGRYSFGMLTPGTYNICEKDDEVTGWMRTYPEASNCQQVIVTAGQDSIANFGNFELGYIQGRKFNDLNNNGQEDSGEPVINSWPIRLYNASWNLAAPEQTTHFISGYGNGRFRFENLNIGTYYICEVLQSGWTQTDPGNTEGYLNQSTATDEAHRCRKAIINQSGQQLEGKLFGNIHLGTITVDKATAPTEDPQAFDFTITKDTTTVDSFSLADTESPHTGAYQSGHYTISESENADWEAGDISCQSTGGISNLETHASPTNPPARVSFDLAAGGNVTCTFNNIKYGSVEVTKFNDTNNNGIYDDDESTMSGWDIILTGQETKTTDEAGMVSFTGLSPSSYYLDETIKDGWEQTVISCSNDQELTSIRPSSTSKSLFGIEKVQAQEMSGHRVNVEAGENVTCVIGNHYIPAVLQISKENNITTDITPGSSVLYTLTVKSLDNTAYGVKVTDLLPKGFAYRGGSWTASSNVRGALALSEPTYHSPGTWDVGNIEENEVITLTLMADVSTDEKPGLYKDLALAYGCQQNNDCAVGGTNSLVATAVDPGQLNTTFVGTEVAIVKDQQDSKTLTVNHEETTEGSVLGATTDLPSTGANSNWIVVAITLMITGLGAIVIANKMRRYHA
ncbi:MAG: SdrD B-like domain-containing protein [Microgenomates group bacterium]